MRSRLLLTLLFAVVLLHAQDTQGLLKGTVTDPKGAAVAAATVEIRNQETGSVRTLATTESGYFIAPNLKPGPYTVKVSAAGFRAYVRSDIVLETSQPVEIAVPLTLGEVTQSITIMDDGLEIDTAKSDRTWTLRGDQLGELPMPDRNMLAVLTQVPGVTWFSGGDARGFTNEDVSYISVNGGSVRMNSFQIDGASNNTSYADTTTKSASVIGNNPTADAVKEVKVITNVYDAQTGRTAGAVVQVNLKSGGQQFHGSVYDYAYRTWLEANSFQNNANGRPRSRHILDQPGFTASGPVLAPRVWDGRKRKTFFFASYEYFRDIAPNDRTVSVPEPEMLTGDFSKLTNSARQSIVIYDPATGVQSGTAWKRTPFAGNGIPQARINPIMQKVLGYMMKPNQASNTNNYSASNLYLYGVTAQTVNYWKRMTLKFDHELSASHRISFRYNRDTRDQDSTNNGLCGVGADITTRHDTPRSYALSLFSNLTPHVFGEFRLSASTYQQAKDPGENYGFDKTTLGFPTSLTSQIPGGAYFGRYDFSGYSSLGVYRDGWKVNAWNGAANITQIRGTHTIKTGADFNANYSYTMALGNALQYSFNDVFTRADYLRSDSLNPSGNAIASALLGSPASGTSTVNARLALLSKYMAGYIQDDWKVSRRLTLNLGFRYDLYLPITERFNRIISNFDSSVANPVDSQINRAKFANVPTLTGGVLFAGVDGQPRRSMDVWKGAWQPRFGFAYELRRNIVVRGGFGRSFWSSQDDMYTQYGYSVNTALVASNDDNRTPRADALVNPFPSGLVPVTGNSSGLATNLGQAINYQHRDFKLPYQNQFSLNFQIKLPANSRIELGYVGTRTYDMRVDVPENEISLATRKLCNALEGGTATYCSAQQPNPFQNLAPFIGTTRYTSTQLTRAELLRPMPEFGAITGRGYNLGRGWYNAFQTIYEIRNRHGMVFNVSYTWSKNMQRAGGGVGGLTMILDTQNLILDQSPNFYNRPHAFTFAGVADLPFGRGKAYLSGSNAMVRSTVSGWQLSSRFDLASGILADMPVGGYVRNAVVDTDWHPANGVVQIWRPCVARVQDAPGAPLQLLDRGLNQQFGCTLDNVNWLVLPSYAPRQTPAYMLDFHRAANLGIVNLALNRNFKLRERFRIAFRAEAYNLLNRFIMFKGVPPTDPTSTTFGMVIKQNVSTSQSFMPRRFSGSLKLNF